MLATIFLSLYSIVKFALNVEKDELKELNRLLKQKLTPITYHLGRSNDPFDIQCLGDQANVILRDFLLEHPEAFEVVDPNKKSEFIKHNSKTLEEAIRIKNTLRKVIKRSDATTDDRKKFRLALSAIRDLRKLEQKKELLKTARHQEELYFKNKWDFARKACNGTLEKAAEIPTFDKATADQFYQSTYSIPKTIDLSALNWFPHLPVNSDDESFNAFSMDPFRPRDIKQVLINSNKNSSPGPDGIPYSILLKLPTLHHTLATLFTKVLHSGVPPKSWSESVIKLVHKKGDTKDPSNFRMIALTNCIGKLYHLLLSRRFTTFLTENNYFM